VADDIGHARDLVARVAAKRFGESVYPGQEGCAAAPEIRLDLVTSAMKDRG
jgi:hypothetical protein